MNNKAYFFFLVLLVLIGAFYFYNKYQVAPTLDLKQLDLVDLNQNKFDLQQLKGKKIALLMAASWCPNCIEELDELAQMNPAELADINIIVVSDEPIDKIMAFKIRKNYPFEFLKLNKSFADIGIASIPTAYLFNPSLQIVKQSVGAIHWSDPSTLQHLKTLMN